MEPPNKGMQTDGRFAAAADRRGVRHSVSQDAIEELLNCVLRTTRDKNGGPMWTAGSQTSRTLAGLAPLLIALRVSEPVYT